MLRSLLWNKVFMISTIVVLLMLSYLKAVKKAKQRCASERINERIVQTLSESGKE